MREVRDTSFLSSFWTRSSYRVFDVHRQNQNICRKTFWIVQIFNFSPEVESETKHIQTCISH